MRFINKVADNAPEYALYLKIVDNFYVNRLLEYLKFNKFGLGNFN